MDRIAREIESSAFYQETMFSTTQKDRVKVSTITESISSATCKIAMEIGARCIISATTSGSTARMVSKFRPNIPIIAVTHDKYVKHYLTVCWGIHPIQLAVRGRTTDELINNSIKAARRYGLVKPGDRVVITAGTHSAGTTNLIEVIDV